MGGAEEKPKAAPAPAEICAAPKRDVPDVEALWNKLNSNTECKSLLKRNLTEDIYMQLKDKKTSFGGTLGDCIKSGCENPESGVGIYACDPEGYTVFAPILDKVIMEYHKVTELNHPAPDFGEDKIDFGNLDPDGEMIVSTRVRVGRSHDSYGFPPVLSKQDRIDMEKKTVEALNSLEGDLAGTYYPLLGMTKEVQTQLTEDHFLFNDSDRFLKAAGGYNDWPVGRGIFHTPDKKFLVWVNEEDHMRLISMQMGGDLAEVYLRLVNAIKTMEKKLSFAKRQGLGYLTFCPSNLGTALRASVHVKIPNLAATPDFKAFLRQVQHPGQSGWLGAVWIGWVPSGRLGGCADRWMLSGSLGIHGEHTESVGGVYDISNKRRLGLTEYEAIQEMRTGVEAVIEEEKKLAG
nr:hypothetical protein BaRGS_022803 [Batillaria attramentaria]